MKNSLIDNVKEKFEELFKLGLSDYKIAEVLGVNHCTVFLYRRKHGYSRKSLRVNKSIPITEQNLEVLIGTLLGDSSLELPKNGINPRLSCEHSIKLSDYCRAKALFLENLGSKVFISKRNKEDPRTGIMYEYITCRLPANPELLPLYNAFYKYGKKVIPMLLMNHFTALSLAILFMDDGYKIASSYAISTNCFTEEEITEFRKFLFVKFNLETSMFKKHQIYIHHKSKALFEKLISPYLHPSMEYKLNVS